MALAAGHQREGLTPSPGADRRTLIRRLSFDLTGLSPTPADIDRFIDDGSPQSYEKVVDHLLASDHYGERMAVFWLDVVRYADTGGYHSDNHRDVWAYRDCVIAAFNRNESFDRFTIEQLAGDLIDGPTPRSRIASGYNRLLMTTEEGGAQPREYQIKYAADRTRNTAAAWLGVTLGCAECHDHKPKLAELDGKPMPESYTKGQPIAQLQGKQLNCFAPQFPFAHYGQSGQHICTLFPGIGSVADEICIIHSMVTDAINHDPAYTFMNTGAIVPGRPAMGSWLRQTALPTTRMSSTKRYMYN